MNVEASGFKQPTSKQLTMRSSYFLLILNLLFLVSNINKVKCQSKIRVYIVYMGASSSPTINGEHAQLLSELIKRKNNTVIHTYSKSFLGIAARLSANEAKSIAKRPGVVSVFPNSMLQLHTTRSWDFLISQTAPKNNINSIHIGSRLNVSNGGSSGHDTIIGIIDTGIWPQHPSFDDRSMGPIPQRWKGICMSGENSTIPFKCNRKVIGARYYDDPEEPGSITTAIDGEGHGTHVASTAAGISVPGASYYGLAKGVARGGSPSSRIAAYCICGDNGCDSSSVLKAFDDAIDDGVDVISISLGGHTEGIFTDSLAIGAFHAAEKGVTVVASAGNGGPSGTVINTSPWIITAAATTMDRDFQVDIVLGGGNDVIKGGGINFSDLNKSAVYDLIDGRSAGCNKNDLTNASNCIPGSLHDAKVKGKIVLCENTDPISIYDKIEKMMDQGVIAIIMIDSYLRQTAFHPPYDISFVVVTEEEGTQIQSYINSTRVPLATILSTEVVLKHKPAPVVAYFSSRGPATDIKNVLKPDIAAPGVAILAAWRFNDTNAAYPGKEPQLYKIISGTSMSTPHVSGVAATVKSWHPTWTHSAIRSAIMTTAISINNDNVPITTVKKSRATPYDIGSGEISIFNPLCPGLVYETKTIDYILFLCNLGYNTSVIKLVTKTLPSNYACPSNSGPDLISDMNYPSIVISGLKENAIKMVKRTVTNVGRVYSTYTATMEAPAGVQVQVVPKKLQFTKRVKKLSFHVKFTLTTPPSQNDLFGSIAWSDNIHNVRSPFVISNA